MQAKKAKQYLLLGEATVIEHSLKPLLSHPFIHSIVVVLHPADKLFKQLALAKHPKIHTTIGGKERVDSVAAGLQYAKSALQVSSDSYCLVHDAARPCLTKNDIDQLLNKIAQVNHGAILASPVVDTLKRMNTNADTISSTVDRTDLWRALTPQAFPIDQLHQAIEWALSKQQVVTDEASAMEAQNYEVALVEGDARNIKITHPADLALAAFYIATIAEETK